MAGVRRPGGQRAPRTGSAPIVGGGRYSASTARNNAGRVGWIPRLGVSRPRPCDRGAGRGQSGLRQGGRAWAASSTSRSTSGRVESLTYSGQGRLARLRPSLPSAAMGPLLLRARASWLYASAHQGRDRGQAELAARRPGMVRRRRARTVRPSQFLQPLSGAALHLNGMRTAELGLRPRHQTPRPAALKFRRWT
jgi:hypothetical protein